MSYSHIFNGVMFCISSPYPSNNHSRFIEFLQTMKTKVEQTEQKTEKDSGLILTNSLSTRKISDDDIAIFD